MVLKQDYDHLHVYMLDAEGMGPKSRLVVDSAFALFVYV